MFSAPVTCSSSSMASGMDRELRLPCSTARGSVVGPPVVGAGVGDLGQLAGAGGVQAGAVAPLVLPLVEVGGERTGGDDRGGPVLDQQQHRGLGVAGHHRLGQVGHRLQQAVHRQLAQGQAAQALQRLGGVGWLRVLGVGHGGPPVCSHRGLATSVADPRRVRVGTPLPDAQSTLDHPGV
jgi:hypothetical protein